MICGELYLANYYIGLSDMKTQNVLWYNCPCSLEISVEMTL